MDKVKINRFSSFIFTLVILGVFSSCISHKQLLYLQENKKEASVDSFSYSYNDSLIITSYTIQKGDLLNVQITSTVASNIEIFKQEYGTSSQLPGNSGIANYLNGYEVDEEGMIHMPLIGKIKVVGLTTTGITQEIESRLSQYLKFITVATKLISFRITMFGEVNSPGTIYVYQKKMTIFEAIALASNVTDAANLERVKIIRQVPNGSKVTRIDLSKKDIIASEYYFLRPNDIVYVEPLKLKAFRLNSGAISTTLSVITFVIVLTNLFKTK